MKLKPYAFKAIETAAVGAGCVCVASVASFAISGITLFTASPFIPDSSEEVIGRWMFKSGLVAALGASANFLCWHILFDSVGMNRRSDKDDELTPLPEPIYPAPLPDYDAIFQQTTSSKAIVPPVCHGCYYLNSDITTVCELLCAVRGKPESDVCCPDRRSAGEA